MKWLKDEDDELINLHYITRIGIREVQDAEPAEPTHCIAAEMHDGAQMIIFRGDEADCRAKLSEEIYGWLLT